MSASKPPKAPTSFETDVEANFGNTQTACHISRVAAGTCEIGFSQPKAMRGMSLTWDGEELKLKYHDLSFGIEPSKYPQTAFGTAMINAFDSMVRVSELKIAHEENTWVYKGKCKSGNFILTQDDKTGFYKSLSVPELKFTAQFKNFKEIN